MKVIIGTDIGTSGVKVLAVDENCRVVGSNVTEYPIYTPNPGWTEQNPDDWWNAAAAGLKKLIPQLSGYEIAGVGLSGQMHGMVALDAENRVVRPAILWNDQRTEKQCKEIISAAGGLDSLISMTNNGMLTGFTAGKILWMKENEPENYKKTVRIVNPKDYIAYKLTGNVGTDVSDASGTGLFDVVNGRFSDRLITLCGLSLSLFAEVHESSDIIGRVTGAASEFTGIPEGTPVCAGGGDAVLSTVAMGAADGRSAAVMLGTSGVVSAHVPEFTENTGAAVQFSRACIKGMYQVMGVTLSAAGSYKWFCENFSSGDYKGTDAMAESSPCGAGGVIFLPYLNGERCPVNDPNARGCFVGLSAGTGKGDLARAVLEGVAFSLKQTYDRVSPEGTAERVILAGGGSKSPLWRQIFADVFGLPVVTLDGAGEGSGFGAAVVAGIGCGVFSSASEAAAKLTIKTQTLPIPENVAACREICKKYSGLYGRLAGL